MVLLRLLVILLSFPTHLLDSLLLSLVPRPFLSRPSPPSIYRIQPEGVFVFVEKSRLTTSSSSSTSLNIGRGEARHYRWKEEPNEIEVTVKVPANTRTKDILFKVTPTTVDLRCKNYNSIGTTVNDTCVILLSGDRSLRGKVCVDGTFWSISDSPPDREVTVIMEKNKRKGEFEVETDWEGVFVEDDEEVLLREYEEPEELDVRDYCKRELKVDIDNIDMGKVDKTMFSTTNMTQNLLQDLKKGGFVREVTQQGDLEFIEERDGSRKELEQSIPFIDRTSSYHDTETKTDNATATTTTKTAADPIDSLTVARLKEILREQNLKVSGTKQELQDRLRNHVQSVVDQND